MAQTLQEITDALHAAYPTLSATVNGVTSTLDAAAYDARIADMAQMTRDQQLADEASAAQKTLRAQVRTARTRLQQIATATPPFTNAQRDAAIQDIATYLDKLIGVLIDLHQIESS